MRIVNWNCGGLNSSVLRGIKYIYSLNPDIICFQELSWNDYVKTKKIFSGYSSEKILHWVSKSREYRSYTSIFSRFEIVKSRKIKLFKSKKSSLYTELFYKNLFKVNEIPGALMCEICFKKKRIRVSSAQLSVSLRPKERLKQLERFVNWGLDVSNRISCGDFNITSSKLFTEFMGKMIGYTEKDRLVNEGKEASKLFKKVHFNNIFAKFSTCGPKLLKLQFDHILLPKNISKYSIELKGKYGSDHEILLCDAEF